MSGKNLLTAAPTCRIQGGIFLSNCLVYMKGKTYFTENTASGSGGGMFILNPKRLQISDATFSLNMAGLNGGAVSMIAAASQTREFTGCHFECNTVEQGGAMYLFTSAGNETIVNSAFAGNYAGMRCWVKDTSILNIVHFFLTNTKQYWSGGSLQCSVGFVRHTIDRLWPLLFDS